MPPKTPHFYLEITSDLANLARVADYVEKVAQATGLDERQAYDVQMAVDEAVTNVMEHAYEGQRDGHIWITTFMEKKNLVIEIRDRGVRFDPATVKTPNTRGPLNKRTIGGLGIFFMRKLMNKVEFSYDPELGNLTRMYKRVK
jgi:serine/threonine-protein kinase RsbW